MSVNAATLLMSGTTFHNKFGIPIICFEYFSSSLNFRSIGVDVIKKSVLIIFDEFKLCIDIYWIKLVYSFNLSWEILN